MAPNDSRLLTLKIEQYSDIKRYNNANDYMGARQLIIELEDYLMSDNPTTISQLPKKFDPITSIKV